MGVQVGIVIEADNPAYEGFAKVRIPTIHGMPLTSKQYSKMKNKFEKYLNTSNTINGNNVHNVELYNIAYFGADNNTKVVSDVDIPWIPIVYPFNSNSGPHLFDLVYVVDNYYIVGWANNTYYPST